MTAQDRGGAGEVAAQLVVKNIRPEPIDSPSPLGYGSDHHREVAWILGEEEDQPISDRLPYELREKVARALVEKIVRARKRHRHSSSPFPRPGLALP